MAIATLLGSPRLQLDCLSVAELTALSLTSDWLLAVCVEVRVVVTHLHAANRYMHYGLILELTSAGNLRWRAPGIHVAAAL